MKGPWVERVVPNALQELHSQTSALRSARSTHRSWSGHFRFSAFGFQLSRRGRKAFTLVEVLISLGIFAVAAVVLGSAYVNILVNYQAMRAWSADREELAFARARLLAEPDRAKVERGGEMTLLAGGNLHWKATIAELPRADLFRVTVDLEVTPPPPVPPRREQEVFVLLRPTWSDPAQREKLRAAFRDDLAKREF